MSSLIDTYRCYGYALELLAKSEYHQQFSLGEYLWQEVVPPLSQGQVRFYLDEHSQAPTGCVTWAWLSEAVEQDLHRTGRALQPDEWNSGDRLFFNDFIAPYGHTRGILRDMTRNVFPAHQASSLDRNPDASVRKVCRWTGVDYRKQQRRRTLQQEQA